MLSWYYLFIIARKLTKTLTQHVIFHFMSFLIDYPHDTKDCISLLSKCLLAIVDLLQKDILTTTQHVCCREDVCKTLFLLFILLGDSEEEVPRKFVDLNTSQLIELHSSQGHSN